MPITLTSERKKELLAACLALLKQTKVKIRTVASCIGLMVASFLVVPMGPLHYRALAKCNNNKKAIKIIMETGKRTVRYPTKVLLN